jgi:hypothetical protein
MFPTRKNHSIKSLLAIILVTLPISRGQAQSVVIDRWGWGYCAPPYRPTCIDNVLKDPGDRANCETVIKAFVDEVIRYRICLSTETSRAVLEANLVLDALKCSKRKEDCSAHRQGKELPATRR